MALIDLHELKDLPKSSVVSVIGAGGKTSSVHDLADHYRRQGYKVLVTTTTHMAEEEGLLSDLDGISRALSETGFAFAGRLVDHKGKKKVASLPEDVLKKAIALAEITLIEADGARRLPFKAPKPSEPVIHPETTHVLLLGGMWAIGRPLEETAYNLPGILSACPDLKEDSVVTPELMAEVYRKTYVNLIRQKYPGLPLFFAAGQTDTVERQRAAEVFLLEMQKPLTEEDLSPALPDISEKDSGRIFAVCMASGFGRRFGSNKLLARYRGKALYRHLVDKLVDIRSIFPSLEVLVVSQHDRILKDMAEADIPCVKNHEAAEGQASSVRCGLDYVRTHFSLTEKDHLVFFVCDQPHLKKETLQAFFLRLKADHPLILAFANAEGRPVNPAAFSASLFDELMALKGDTGARPLLKAHAGELVLFTEAGSDELTDIDRPEDLIP